MRPSVEIPDSQKAAGAHNQIKTISMHTDPALYHHGDRIKKLSRLVNIRILDDMINASFFQFCFHRLSPFAIRTIYLTLFYQK